MDKKIILWIIVAVLIVAVLYFTFRSTGNVATAQAGASAVKSVASSSSGMVGGC